MTLREWRKAKGFTKRDLARAAGVSATTINLWEAGKIEQPHRSSVAAVARVLGLTVEELYRALAASMADAWRIETRAAQGLPPEVHDRTALAEVQRIALGPANDPDPQRLRNKRSRPTSPGADSVSPPSTPVEG